MKYINKSFPITLQDLIELASTYHQDPKDLRISLNDSNPDYSNYTHYATLNPDQGRISIELYTNNPNPNHIHQ